MEIYVLKLTLVSIMIIQSITNIKCENKTDIQKSPLNPLEHLLLHENTQDPQKQDESHIRVKRQFYYPYGYYRRPIPIIIGGIGVFGGGYGFGRPGFGGRGFGGRGFGGRGFGGRGFGGRGFGGRGFGGRGIGGIGGRGIGGFGGRGGRG